MSDTPVHDNPKEHARDAAALMSWYRGVRRDLPWRRDRDPYRIWVSEVMLQQTTVAAVVPFYERFMRRFPDLRSLAQASVADVIENWAGLGYYSRARNLHRSAQALVAAGGFPRTHLELIELPGFGPYTARAVASLAFDEKTGVLDGNVIRVLSRRFGLALEWWKPKGRDVLQVLSDRLAQVPTPADLNQGLMELGATVCTPQAPSCLLCPWAKACEARKAGRLAELPLKKPRREREIWEWRPRVVERGGRFLVLANDYAPFLKGHWLPPGEVKRLKSSPKRFDFKGTVTHHDIFISVIASSEAPKTANETEARWVKRADLAKEIPSSLVRRALATKETKKESRSTP